MSEAPVFCVLSLYLCASVPQKIEMDTEMEEGGEEVSASLPSIQEFASARWEAQWHGDTVSSRKYPHEVVVPVPESAGTGGTGDFNHHEVNDA